MTGVKRLSWALVLAFIMLAVMAINPLANGIPHWTPVYTAVAFSAVLAVALGLPLGYLTNRYGNERWYAVMYLSGVAGFAAFIVYLILSFKAQSNV